MEPKTMRLIASNRDYYDHYARDRRLSDQAYKWERKPRVVPIDFAIPEVVHNGLWGVGVPRLRHVNFDSYGFVVWFCGRPVPVVKVVRFPFQGGRIVEYFYGFDELPDEVRGDRPLRGKLHARYRNPYQRYQDLFALKDGWGKVAFESVSYSGRVLPKVPVAEMHRRVGSPVFCHPTMIDEHLQEFHDAGVEIKVMARGWRVPEKPCVLVNPVLSHIEFNRAVNAFEAFQELERYVANEMAPVDGRMDKPIPDAIKAQSKGFDKMSFRREPGGKRGRGQRI